MRLAGTFAGTGLARTCFTGFIVVSDFGIALTGAFFCSSVIFFTSILYY
jgi:hypothetical protein